MTSKLTITRDELNEVVATYGKSHIAHRMATELLAAMDSEPVAWLHSNNDIGIPAPVVPEEKPMPNPLSMYAVDAVAAIAEAKGWNACRAAMLQAGNSPVIPDGYVMVPKEPTEDMLQASYREAAVYSPTAYRAMLAVAKHDTPVLNSLQSVDSVADRWIPVSERMPENDGAYLCWDNRYVTTYAFIFGAWQANQFIAKNITHWMPLPAAPQEVK